MKTKLIPLTIALFMGVSVWADDVLTFCVYDKCDKNGYTSNNGYEYIDLGLPSGIKWASCNIGAKKPEDYGNYYAWGEVTPKDDYSWSTYKYANGSYFTLTKYCNNADYGDNGFTDNKTTLDADDDAAHVNWGGNWRMPTSEEIDELLNNCTWTYTGQNGVSGYVVASKTNSNSIFLPEAGYHYDMSSNDANLYWSSSLGDSYPNNAMTIHLFYSYSANSGSSSRSDGCVVRPVCSSSSSPASTSSSCVTLTLYAGGCDNGNVIKCNAGQQINIRAVPENELRHFVRWTDGNTDNPRLVTVAKDTVFTAEFAQTYSGKCGGSLYWKYADHTLTITGMGDMYNYVYNYGIFSYYEGANMPWRLFCDTTDTVALEQGITHIGANAFRGCTALSSFAIPNTVTSIGGDAFYNCKGLTSIVIPSSVTGIPSGLLTGLYALDSISIPAQVFNESGYSEPEKFSYVELNSGEITENVSNVIQRSYKTLRTLDASQTTNTTISDEAFRNCYNLQTLRLPANLTAIPYMAVADCKSLQSITIPATVTEIESSAFENCRSLKSVVFEGATAEETTTDGSTASTMALRRIGNWAFYNCHELQSLTVPEGVTEIGDAAFYGCVYLTDITLPSSMATISDNAFALCSKLQKITVSATTPPAIQAKTFYEVSRTIPVYVPAEAVKDYKSDLYWQEFNIQAASPTAIDRTSADIDTTPRKVLRNGQVYILRNGKTYTLTGVEVE